MNFVKFMSSSNFDSDKKTAKLDWDPWWYLTRPSSRSEKLLLTRTPRYTYIYSCRLELCWYQLVIVNILTITINQQFWPRTSSLTWRFNQILLLFHRDSHSPVRQGCRLFCWSQGKEYHDACPRTTKTNKRVYILLVVLPLPVGPIFLAASRSTYFWTLPVDVLGSSGRKTTVLGAM